MTSEDRFKAAVNVIRSLPKEGSFQPSTDLQLKFYSYFKQATEGPCNVSKPSFWDVVGKAKWDAWKNLGDMPREEAMDKYVDEIKQIIETMSYTESVSQFMDLLGPFYEVVPLGKSDPLLNGDKDSDGGSGRVNGFSDQAESDGDEFSDSYDHIKESAVGSADGGGKNSGGGDNAFSSDDYINEACENNNNNEFEIEYANKISPTDEALLINPTVGKVPKDKDESDKKEQWPSQNGNAIPNNNCNDALENKPAEPNHDIEEESLKTVDKGLDNLILQARGGSDQSVPRTSGTSDLAAATGGNRGARTRYPRDPEVPSNVAERQLGGGSGGSGLPGSFSSAGGGADINEQLALAVIKLQHSIDEINSRLSVLEKGMSSRRSKGPLGFINKTFGVSPNLVLLILVWPFVAQWLIRAAQKRQSS